MDNFLFSVNVTLPIFLVMVVGYFLKQKGMFSEGFLDGVNRFNFSVTLPALVFRDIASIPIREVFDLEYVLFCAGATSICFWGIWAISKFLIKEKACIGAFVQASFRSSAAVLGLAFIQSIYSVTSVGPLMVIGSVPLYNIYSVIVLTFEGKDGENQGKSRDKMKEACVNILKNPIIIAIIIGIGVSYFAIELPVVLSKTVNNVAVMATPLALIGMGVGFEGKKALKKVKLTVVSSFIKLIMQTLIFLPLAIWFGFQGEKIVGILIMLAGPATPSCYIMAKNMNNDDVLSSSIIVATTLFSAITLTGWIYVLKVLHVL